MIDRPSGSWLVDEKGEITGPNLADEAMKAREKHREAEEERKDGNDGAEQKPAPPPPRSASPIEEPKEGDNVKK